MNSFSSQILLSIHTYLHTYIHTRNIHDQVSIWGAFTILVSARGYPSLQYLILDGNPIFVCVCMYMYDAYTTSDILLNCFVHYHSVYWVSIFL